MKKILLLSSLMFLGLVNAPAIAANDDPNKNECPVGLVTGQSIEDEFGEGVSGITRCIKNRGQIKLVMQVNQSCRDTTVVSDGAGGYMLENHPKSCGGGRGYGIAQMKNMINDYVVTHGIPADKLDLKIVVHGGGGLMLLDDDILMKPLPWGDNNLQGAVVDLIAGNHHGVKVKFYFCMNTVRGLANKLGFVTDTADLVSRVIPGVEYVTGGLTALGDFQEEGYVYIQP